MDSVSETIKPPPVLIGERGNWFRLSYGRAAAALLAEYALVFQAFQWSPGLTLQWRRVATRRRVDPCAMKEAIRKLIKDGLLEGELVPESFLVRIKGFDASRLKRHPAVTPMSNDHGVRAGRALRVVTVTRSQVTVRTDKGRDLVWDRTKWASWAKGADFTLAVGK